MKTLIELTEAINVNANKAAKARADYESQMKELTSERAELVTLRALALNDLNLEHIEVAEAILSIEGNISNVCEKEVLTDLAVNDIITGCPHLNKQYFGNKRYDGFYQRNDSEYGYGPRHGYIVERVGLKSEFRGNPLAESQKEACVYYLLNFKKIQAAKMEAAN